MSLDHSYAPTDAGLRQNLQQLQPHPQK